MLTDIQNYTEVLKSINASLQNFTQSGEISNIVIYTYKREIERYGENTMEDAEVFFYRNSEFTLQCLHYDDEEKIIVSLFLIDEMLSKLNLSVQEKLEWMKDFNDAFKREFNADKKLNSQLDKKYREFKPKYLDFLSSDEFLEERSAFLSHIEEYNAALQNLLHHNENQSLRISLRNFFQSIFHMNINRLFVSNQRLFEMIIYDYLVRYYKSENFHHLWQTS